MKKLLILLVIAFVSCNQGERDEDHNPPSTTDTQAPSVDTLSKDTLTLKEN